MKIIPATLEHAHPAAELIVETMDSFGDYLLGLGSRARHLKAVQHFFTLPGNRFSFQHCHVAVENSTVAGVLVTFPAYELDRVNRILAGHLFKEYNLGEVLKLACRSLPSLSGPEVFPGEFYVAHIAVSPAFRRQGIARALLDFTDQMARDRGFKTVSLNVDYENEPAKTLYLSHGYRVGMTYATPNMFATYGTSGYDHMVKDL